MGWNGLKCKTRTSFAQEKFRSTKDVFLENYLIVAAALLAWTQLLKYVYEIDILTQRTLNSFVGQDTI